MARVRANQLGFDGKQLREPGEEFDFDGEPAGWFDALDNTGRTKKDIIAKLDQLGIDYNQRDAKEVLAQLLDDALAKAAEAAQKAAEEQGQGQ